MRPRLRSVRRRADCEIAIKSDLEAASARALRRPPELAVGEPLAEKSEFEALAVALDRLVDRLRFAVSQVFWPLPPVLAGLPAGDGLEGGEAPQGFAARSREGMVVGDQRIARAGGAGAGEGRAPGLKRCALGPPHGLVLYGFGRSRRRKRRRQAQERGVDRAVARQAAAVERVDENRIEEAAIGGKVGARAIAVAREQHMQGAHAEIGRPRGAGFLGGERQRREVANPLVAAVLVGAPQGVDLGGDAEPLAQGGVRAVGLRGGDGQRAFDTADDEPVAADRERREGDCTLGDGASVGQVAPYALARLDPPFAGRAVFAGDPRVGGRGQIAQWRNWRLAEAEHEREGQGAAMRFIDEARETVARSGFAADVEAEGGKKRNLGLRRDGGALSSHVPPFAGDARGARERVDRLGARRSGTGTALRRPRFGENERGAGVKPHPVGERDCTLGRLRTIGVDERPPRHAGARLGQADLGIRGRPVHRHRDAIGPAALRRGEDGDHHRAGRVVPAALRHRPVGVAPFDIGKAARVERRSGQESVARQRGVAQPRLDEPGGEGDERSVGALPVDRACRVVLGVGVVVAALAEAKLHAHGEHRRSARSEEQRQQIALVARTRLEDRRIVARTLDAVVPAQVVVRPVAIVLAVGLVVLLRVGDEVAQGKAVVGDDEIDALGRGRGMVEDVAGARDPGCDFAAQAGVAAPEAARGVAEAVVPFRERGAEPAEQISSRTHVPRFGDEARSREDRIGVERLEEWRLRVEAVRAAAE